MIHTKIRNLSSANALLLTCICSVLCGCTQQKKKISKVKKDYPNINDGISFTTSSNETVRNNMNFRNKKQLNYQANNSCENQLYTRPTTPILPKSKYTSPVELHITKNQKQDFYEINVVGILYAKTDGIIKQLAENAIQFDFNINGSYGYMILDNVRMIQSAGRIMPGQPICHLTGLTRVSVQITQSLDMPIDVSTLGSPMQETNNAVNQINHNNISHNVRPIYNQMPLYNTQQNTDRSNMAQQNIQQPQQMQYVSEQQMQNIPNISQQPMIDPYNSIQNQNINHDMHHQNKDANIMRNDLQQMQQFPSNQMQLYDPVDTIEGEKTEQYIPQNDAEYQDMSEDYEDGSPDDALNYDEIVNDVIDNAPIADVIPPISKII